MKNIFALIVLAGCFTIFTSTTTSAQDIVKNSTNCDFRITVLYGPGHSCLGLGSITKVVPANSQVNLGIPAGNVIIKAEGGYTVPVSSSSCYFAVGLSCTGHSTNEVIFCVGGCGNYEVTYIPSFGLKIRA